MATVAKLTAGIALATLVACMGTGRVSVESPFVGIEAEWEKAPEPVEQDKEYIYRVTGQTMEVVRGEKYKAVFRDAEGKQIGEHEGEVPAEGPLEIPTPADAHTVDWATGDDIEKLDFQLPPVMYRMQQQGIFKVFRSTRPGSTGQVMEFGFTLTAGSLDGALERAHDLATFAPLNTKPNDVMIHYFVKALHDGQWVNVISMKQTPSPDLWVDVNRSWASDASADVSQNGWIGRAVVVPLDALNVPTLPGVSVSNSLFVLHGAFELRVDIETSL